MAKHIFRIGKGADLSVIETRREQQGLQPLTFESDSQEVEAIKEHIGGTKHVRALSRFESFLLDVGDGEYMAVYGIERSIPRCDETVYLITSKLV